MGVGVQVCAEAPLGGWWRAPAECTGRPAGSRGGRVLSFSSGPSLPLQREPKAGLTLLVALEVTDTRRPVDAVAAHFHGSASPRKPASRPHSSAPALPARSQRFRRRRVREDG